MPPSIKQRRAAGSCAGIGRLAAGGIRGLEAGFAGASDDGERGGRVGEPPDGVPETFVLEKVALVLEKVALPVMLSRTMP